MSENQHQFPFDISDEEMNEKIAHAIRVVIITVAFLLIFCKGCCTACLNILSCCYQADRAQINQVHHLQGENRGNRGRRQRHQPNTVSGNVNQAYSDQPPTYDELSLNLSPPDYVGTENEVKNQAMPVEPAIASGQILATVTPGNLPPQIVVTETNFTPENTTTTSNK